MYEFCIIPNVLNILQTQQNPQVYFPVHQGEIDYSLFVLTKFIKNGMSPGSLSYLTAIFVSPQGS